MSGKFTPIPAEVLAGLTSEARAGLLEGQRLALKQAALRSGRKVGVKNRPTLRIEAMFDNLLRNNPDCSAEEIRTLKGSKSVQAMSKSTVARHWKAAKKRRLNLAPD